MDPASGADLILWDVVEEHFNEAEFLFGQWERALRSPKYTLKQIAATLEKRLEAHLDGLVVGGEPVAERILKVELENASEPNRAAVAALVLLYGDEQESPKRVREAALAAHGPLQRALTRALVLCNSALLDSLLLQSFREAAEESERAVLLEVLVGRGTDPGNELTSCLHSQNARLTCSALEAVARFGRRELLPLAERHLQSDDPGVRISALKAALVLGSRMSRTFCYESVRSGQDYAPELLISLAVGEASDQAVLYALLEQPARAEQAIWALGFCGTAEASEACLKRLHSENLRHAKLAADSLSWIGGFDFRQRKFQTPLPAPSEEDTLPPLEEDDLGADLALDGVDELPALNVSTIAEWWGENAKRFTESRRHLLGIPFSAEALGHALRTGVLWRRHAAAFELSLASAGQRHVSTDAFSSRQYAQLGALPGAHLSRAAAR